MRLDLQVRVCAMASVCTHGDFAERARGLRGHIREAVDADHTPHNNVEDGFLRICLWSLCDACSQAEDPRC